MKTTITIIFPIMILMTTVISFNVYAKPVIETPTEQRVDFESNFEGLNATNSTNSTRKELYVIRAVVYEIGILTDVPDNETEEYDDEDESDEVQQQVQLTFNAKNKNGTLDFGDIPLPVQTNVSGQILTGIAPVHVGQVSSLDHLLATLPITGTIVNITQSEGGMFTLETKNVTEADQSTVIDSAADLSPLSLVSNSLPHLPTETVTF